MPLQYQWDTSGAYPKLKTTTPSIRPYTAYRMILECLILCPDRTASTEQVAESLRLPVPWVLDRLKELHGDGLLRPIYGRGWRLQKSALAGGPYGDLLDVIGGEKR